MTAGTVSRECAWRDTGVWLMGDTHVHHRQAGLERIVDEASALGCDFLAFTEHSFFTEYLEMQPELIQRAARVHPDMILVNGTEWSTPIGNQERSEQTGLLMPGGCSGMSSLREFLGKYDVKVAGAPLGEDVFLDALRWLGSVSHSGVLPLVILTHPHSVHAAFTTDQIRRAMHAGPALGALCASSRPPEAGFLEVWPWAAEIGGACDQLFADGYRPVLLAESHFHRHWRDGGEEFWPGEFRRNYVYCPGRTEADLFRGLRSGASYFVLGDVISDLQFSACHDGTSIIMGETLHVPPGEAVEITLGFAETRPVEAVELIGNLGGECGIAASVHGTNMVRCDGRAGCVVRLKMGDHPCYLRARGFAHIGQPYPMKAPFYTNPIWLAVG